MDDTGNEVNGPKYAIRGGSLPTDDSDNDEGILSGSPFAPGSVVDAADPSVPGTSSAATGAAVVSATAKEVLTDGAMKYTAKGAATASLMVVFFAAAAAWWFPAGGVLIAALGSALAVGGMFSDYRMPAAVLLIVHLGLFFASYTLTMS